ncbi:hypothetical protein GGI09_003584 [Coemansia sp. S100]|nr:hypothetical protein GGI09_003584 [Coemansia sp. S100]KAJ2110051.1 hypothetical protein GGI16_000469 [Coemansia sp. S142-1]
MVHINDLHRDVLAQILYKAVAAPAKNLSEWKVKLPLLGVCRKWTELALSFVFYQVFVELPELPGPSLDAHFLWTSNAELLISRRCVLRALRLTIQLPYDVTPDHIRIIALEILKLDRVDWQHVNSLAFTFATWTFYLSAKPVSQDDKTATDVARTAQYFAQNLRNIAELDFCSLSITSAGKFIFSNIATFYGGRLQILRSQGFILLPITCIPRNIRVLELTLDSSAVRVLPSICGETLKVLKLDEIPRNFAWHHFRYDIFDLPIVFHQLTVLHFTFKEEYMSLTEAEIDYKVASGAHCCDQLCFPALRELSIENCTPDCDLLYADIPFPKLKKVHLSGSINCIRHCSRLRFNWVRNLSVVILSVDSGDTAEIYRVTNHFFADIRIGRAASLRVTYGWFDLDPDEMRWTNITILEVDQADYTTVCKAISRLPNLCELTISSLEFGNLVSSGSTEDSALFISADPMLAWGERLAILTICNFDENCPLSLCIDGIQALLLHAGALEKLIVPESVHRLVVGFVDMYKDRYSHLANIQLLIDETNMY